MNVIPRTDNYIARFLTLRFNYPGTNVEVIDFDNVEITKDVGMGERPIPEIHKSAAGYASKIAKFQPKRLEVTFKLAYPETIQKLNKLIKYTGEKYVCDLFLNSVTDYSVTANGLQDNQQIVFRTVYEYAADLIFRLQGRGHGIQQKEEIPFTFWGAQTLEAGRESSVLVTTAAGGVYGLKTGVIASTSALPGGGGALSTK